MVFGTHKCKKYKLDCTKDEFKHIKAEFNKHVNAEIKFIERIQNRLLWTKFEAERESLRAKFPFDPIHQLWHGHKLTPLESITEGDEGFDMRFANNGRYGHGIYFAISPKYCMDGQYYHTRPDGLKSLIYAHVLIGKEANDVD